MNERTKKSSYQNVSERHAHQVNNARIERGYKDMQRVGAGLGIAALAVGGMYLLGKAGFSDPAGPPNPNARHGVSPDTSSEVFQLPDLNTDNVQLKIDQK